MENKKLEFIPVEGVEPFEGTMISKYISSFSYNDVMYLVQYITEHSNASITEAIQLASFMLSKEVCISGTIHNVQHDEY